jgi:hypothetical protein
MRTRLWQSDSQYYKQYTRALKIDTEMTCYKQYTGIFKIDTEMTRYRQYTCVLIIDTETTRYRQYTGVLIIDTEMKCFKQYTGVLKIDTEMDVSTLQNRALISRQAFSKWIPSHLETGMLYMLWPSQLWVQAIFDCVVSTSRAAVPRLQDSTCD